MKTFDIESNKLMCKDHVGEEITIIHGDFKANVIVSEGDCKDCILNGLAKCHKVNCYPVWNENNNGYTLKQK